MTDRELLEAAAQAAANGAEWYAGLGMGFDNGTGVPTPWQPLTDSGDALDLAIRLRLNVCHYGDCVAAGPWQARRDAEEWTGMAGADPYAATRRAIVRAAAALA